MPTPEILTPTPRKELHVFYVLDTSGSMAGAKISALNHAMEECTVALKDLAKRNADADLKIAVLEFNSGCKWVTYNGPEALEDFEYEHLKCGGITDMGCALKELNSKLSRKAWLGSMTGALMPVIIFMTDGFATDDYKSALEEIRQNKWFHRGTKIGFAIGEDGDVDTGMISSIVGNSEAVIKTTDLELFGRLMRFVSVTASMLVSQTVTTNDIVTGGDVVQKVIEDSHETEAEVVSLDPDSYLPEPPADDEEDDDDWTKNAKGW